ncbi:hypothetical protein [uncultured Desulfobacter sp.]|uniref:hypothetical protein n=1 Tax=uncultured Desulfobacter sp. TaxID=240139 RepID=UPI0029F52787|nr:hypothetical protein [uncultured Desulfobacter sp.]
MTAHTLSVDGRFAVFEDLGIREYVQVLDLQTTAREKMIRNPGHSDRVFFVQHPAVYTLGKRGGRENLVVSEEFLAEKGIEIVRPPEAEISPFTDLARRCSTP